MHSSIRLLIFGKSFLNIKEIENLAAEKASKKFNRSLTIGGILIAVLLTYASLEPLILKKVHKKNNTVEQLIMDQKELENENLELRKSVYSNKILLDSLMKEQ